jgi:hypothetical protein
MKQMMGQISRSAYFGVNKVLNYEVLMVGTVQTVVFWVISLKVVIFLPIIPIGFDWPVSLPTPTPFQISYITEPIPYPTHFIPEQGGNMFLRNAASAYTVLQIGESQF